MFGLRAFSSSRKRVNSISHAEISTGEPYCARVLLKRLLRAILSLSCLPPPQVILDLLGLSNKYDFAPLQTSIMAFLRATLNVTNVCFVYNVSTYFQLRDLSFACSTFVDAHAAEVMKSDGFLSLSLSALTELSDRDSFFAPEIDIYRGIVRWVGHNEVETEVSRRLLRVVRLQLIPMEHLLGEIRGSKLFDPDHILDAITMCTTKRSIELRQRGLLSESANIQFTQSIY